MDNEDWIVSKRQLPRIWGGVPNNLQRLDFDGLTTIAESLFTSIEKTEFYPSITIPNEDPTRQFYQLTVALNALSKSRDKYFNMLKKYPEGEEFTKKLHSMIGADMGFSEEQIKNKNTKNLIEDNYLQANVDAVFFQNLHLKYVLNGTRFADLRSSFPLRRKAENRKNYILRVKTFLKFPAPAIADDVVGPPTDVEIAQLFGRLGRFGITDDRILEPHDLRFPLYGYEDFKRYERTYGPRVGPKTRVTFDDAGELVATNMPRKIDKTKVVRLRHLDILDDEQMRLSVCFFEENDVLIRKIYSITQNYSPLGNINTSISMVKAMINGYKNYSISLLRGAGNARHNKALFGAILDGQGLNRHFFNTSDFTNINKQFNNSFYHSICKGMKFSQNKLKSSSQYLHHAIEVSQNSFGGRFFNKKQNQAVVSKNAIDRLNTVLKKLDKKDGLKIINGLNMELIQYVEKYRLGGAEKTEFETIASGGDKYIRKRCADKLRYYKEDEKIIIKVRMEVEEFKRFVLDWDRGINKHWDKHPRYDEYSEMVEKEYSTEDALAEYKKKLYQSNKRLLRYMSFSYIGQALETVIKNNDINEMKTWLMDEEMNYQQLLKEIRVDPLKKEKFSLPSMAFNISDFFRLSEFKFPGKEELAAMVSELVLLIGLNSEFGDEFVELVEEKKDGASLKKEKDCSKDKYNFNPAIPGRIYLSEGRDPSGVPTNFELEFWKLILEFINTFGTALIQARLSSLMDSLVVVLLFIEDGVASISPLRSIKDLYRDTLRELDRVIQFFENHLDELISFELMHKQKVDMKNLEHNLHWAEILSPQFSPINNILYFWDILNNLKTIKYFIKTSEEMDVYDLLSAGENSHKIDKNKDLSAEDFSFEQLFIVSRRSQKREVFNKKFAQKYLRKFKNTIHQKDYQKYSFIRKEMSLSNSNLKKSLKVKGCVQKKGAIKWLKAIPGKRKLKPLRWFYLKNKDGEYVKPGLNLFEKDGLKNLIIN